MICTNCGREVFGEARFCPNCSAPLGESSPQTSTSAATPTPKAPRRRGKLWHLHTYAWTGICPKCQTPHTSENARCPNDGSPLVVAFNCWRWNPFGFPVHTAHLRCSDNCGFSTSVFPCTRDSTVIGSVNLKFRPPITNTFIHNWIFTFGYAASLAFITSLVLYGIATSKLPGGFWHAANSNHLIRIGAAIFIGISWPIWLFWQSVYRWWPFRRTFDFEATSRAATKLRST